MSREYDQLAWVDYPETLTPISAANLNRMENGIANLYTDRNKMENNIAYVEEGETATRHYFINSYLMLNGIFYKTTSEINIGDILDPTLAGNIEHVDVSSQFGSGGGGSTGCVELTQAQYDALSEEAKMLDVIYLITDSPDNYLDEVFGDFASVEYTDTASKAYAVGDYLVYDSKFYKVTSAIAQGDTIVPDTNVVKTTVADEFSNARSVTALSSAFNMNNMKTPGMYFAGVAASSITNWPHVDGWLFFAVYATKNENNAIQIVFGGRAASEAGRTSYVRYLNDGVWGSWVSYRKDVVTDVTIQSFHIDNTVVSASTTKDVTIPITVPTGYTFVYIVDVRPSNSNIIIGNRYMSESTKVFAVLRNLSSAQQSTDVYVSVLFKRMN